MTDVECRELMKQLVLLGEIYGRPLSDGAVKLMIADLEDLPFANVMTALTNYRRNAANRAFPLPAQIRALVNPSIDPKLAAREIAARIVGAVPKYGWANGTEAEAFIGPIGWAIVKKLGGWSHICESLGDTIHPTTFQAQVRDLAEVQLQFPEVAVEKAIGLPGPRSAGSRELESAGSIIGGLLNAGRETPPGMPESGID